MHKAQKKWGQNFLHDTSIIQAIIDAVPTIDSGLYLEIGPGKGALTNLLAERDAPLLAYEIDPALFRSLDAQFKNHDSVHLTRGDFLSRDVDADIEAIGASNAPVHVVANLPYYITTPIIRRCLALTHIQTLTIMVQDEVAKRLAAVPGTKDYGALTVLTQYYATIDYLFTVPPHVFNPAPKVNSAVIQLTIKEERLLDSSLEARFEAFIHQCFGQKRKTLVNNLLPYYDQAKPLLVAYFLENDLNPQSRAEALHLNHLIKIFQKFDSLEHA